MITVFHVKGRMGIIDQFMVLPRFEQRFTYVAILMYSVGFFKLIKQKFHNSSTN